MTTLTPQTKSDAATTLLSVVLDRDATSRWDANCISGSVTSFCRAGLPRAPRLRPGLRGLGRERADRRRGGPGGPAAGPPRAGL